MDREHQAIARGTNLAISKKFCVEIAKFIRGRDLDKAKGLMNGVISKSVAVPFTKHNRDLGHKPGRIAAGRYPVKAAKVVLSLLEAAEMNAMNKGLDSEALYVAEIMANKGTGQMKGGRQRGREAKRTHIDIVLMEREGKKKAKKKEEKPVKEVKPVKKAEKKKEAPKKVEEKKEVKKEETKK